jgi:hypothetical protein
MKTPTLPLQVLAAVLTVALPAFARGAESAPAPVPAASSPATPAAKETPAQPADLKTPARATPENAAAYLGEWSLNLDSPNGPVAMSLALKNNAGRVGGELSSEMQPAQAFSEITRRGTGLELKYTFDYQGTHLEGVVNLTPDNGKMLATISIAEGAYVMEGTAARKTK